MPKKFKGENSKASAARARKEAQKQEAEEKKKKEIDDAYWADDDKHVKQKQQRKEEKERKQREAAERKLELQRLYELEMEASKPKPKAQPPPKLTRVQIQTNKKEIEEANAAANAKQELPVTEIPIEENVNRLMPEDDARTVEEAISLLSTKEEPVDRHPEKRMKAAFKEFEEKNLPILKAENPNMRLSQLKQMLYKDWMKSPQNPLNQARGSS